MLPALNSWSAPSILLLSGYAQLTPLLPVAVSVAMYVDIVYLVWSSPRRVPGLHKCALFGSGGQNSFGVTQLFRDCSLMFHQLVDGLREILHPGLPQLW